MGTVLYRPSQYNNRHFFILKKKIVKMSGWEENIAALKAQGLEHVAFYGIRAGWVVPSDGSNITAAECKTIVDNIKAPQNFQMSGIRAGGQKYMFLSNTETVARGKQALIVGVYGDATQPGSAAVAVENFAAHLEKNNKGVTQNTLQATPTFSLYIPNASR